jgi:NAD(P)-dependent dehydrogenase (short-subunit alcohol dehydrogenase family)
LTTQSKKEMGMHQGIWEPLPAGPRLRGRKIIVTGAASGMGRAIAQLFAREGAALTLFDINGEAQAAVANSIGAHAITVDVSIPDAVAKAVDEADATMHGIDGVVNAAGILRVALFADTEPDMWRRVHDVNLFGPYLVCRAALPALRRAGKATIVNIASMGGIRTPPLMSAYGASKAGLIGLTLGLALELAPAIRANAVCPGIIKTPMTDALWVDDPTGGEAMVRRTVSLQRKGTPMEIAYLTLFLTSDESSFTSGSVYTADGGPVRSEQ